MAYTQDNWIILYKLINAYAKLEFMTPDEFGAIESMFQYPGRF